MAALPPESCGSAAGMHQNFCSPGEKLDRAADHSKMDPPAALSWTWGARLARCVWAFFGPVAPRQPEHVKAAGMVMKVPAHPPSPLAAVGVGRGAKMAAGVLRVTGSSGHWANILRPLHTLFQ